MATRKPKDEPSLEDSTESIQREEPVLPDETLKPETTFKAEEPALPVDSTALQKLGLPYCEKCGYQFVSGLYGEALCAVPSQVDAKECPRLK